MSAGMWYMLGILLAAQMRWVSSQTPAVRQRSILQASAPELRQGCPELNLTIIDERLHHVPAEGGPQLVNICSPEGNATLCCDGFKSVVVLLLSQYLRETGSFRLPNMSAATSCWNNVVDKFANATNFFSGNRTQLCGHQASSLVFDPGFCGPFESVGNILAEQVDISAVNEFCGVSLQVPTACSSCELEVRITGQDLQFAATTLNPNMSYASVVELSSRCFALVEQYAISLQDKADDGTLDCMLLFSEQKSSQSGVPTGGPGSGGSGVGAAPVYSAGCSANNSDPALSPGGHEIPGPGGVTTGKRVGGQSWGWGFYLLVGVGSLFAALCTLFVVLLVLCRNRIKVYRSAGDKKFESRTSELLEPRHRLAWFSYEDIKAATNNFAKENAIGEGAFGTVFKGTLKHGSLVAVKRFKNCSPDSDAEFLNEVEVICSVRHRNLVVLRGCSVKGDTKEGHQRLLVYDFMPNGSLLHYLFSKTKPVLDWNSRMRILIDTGRGISYLHRGAQPSIIHRDIKMSNILLDESLNARVADFGLAKFKPEGMTHMTTRVAGTLGFVAPEYALYGQLTEKSDVYSFGVVLLEVVSGRKALKIVDDNFTSSLISDWAWSLLQDGRVGEVVDSRIRESVPVEETERVVRIGLLCAHLQAACRPNMVQALQMLEGDIALPQVFPNRPLQLTSGTAGDDTSTSTSRSTSRCS